MQVTDSEARFTINVKEGVVELDGKESFVDRHLEKFEEIFALKPHVALPQFEQEAPFQVGHEMSAQPQTKDGNGKHAARPSFTIHPIPVDLKASESKVGLREFEAEKKPANH